MIGVSVFFGYEDKQVAMGIAAFTSLTLLAFSHLDQIAEFKASADGFHAKTRDLVKKAEITLSELQELATILGRIQISLLVRQGRMSGYSEAEQQVYRKEIHDVLEKIGISREKQMDTLKEVIRFTKFDYVSKILGNSIPKGLPSEKVTEWKELRRCLDNPPSISTLEVFLEENGILDEERRELLDDYSHYLETGEHRRLEVFDSV